MAKRKPPPVAQPDEVLALLTDVLRGSLEGCGARERLRAAELLGKRYCLFEKACEDDGLPVVIGGGDELV